uniref:Uncharacterized protein n=1 Tax=Anguilla anguilla TaxID=7936 RepID=A0A0E9W3R5_ANGAN
MDRGRQGEAGNGKERAILFFHLRSMKRMSMIRRVCRGRGLGAGDSTVITWA